jgi:plasmid stability protein
MPDVLVRGIELETVDALKGRAAGNGRSLQRELKAILEQAAQSRITDSRALAARIRRTLGKTRHSDSAKLLAEDRQR